MRAMLPAMGVTDLIFGGWHHHWVDASAEASRAIEDLFQTVGAHLSSGVLRSAWWRTTTARRKGRSQVTDSPMCADWSKSTHPASCSVGCVEGVSRRAATVKGVGTAERAARRAGVGVIDLFEITQRLGRSSQAAAFHADGVHFRCSVYREIDVLLLGLLGC
jgi:hypothetical protein